MSTADGSVARLEAVGPHLGWSGTPNRLASLAEMDEVSLAALGKRRSHRALTVRPHVGGAFPDHLTVGACVDAGTRHLGIDVNADHVVVGNRVHSLQLSALRLTRQWIKARDLAPDCVLNPKEYLTLLVQMDSDTVQPHMQVEVETSAAWDQVRPPPPGLAVSLYPYQLTGYRTLAALADRDLGSMLCDEMGLGKTAQAIALLLSQQHAGRSLVVAPASLLTNWERELNEFAPVLTVARHSGPQRAGVWASLPSVDVVLTTYETLSMDISFMTEGVWNVVVLDEAQKIKNPASTRSRLVKELGCRVPVVVTGTPVENRLTDLWSLAEFVLPPLLGSLSVFRDRYPDEVAAAHALGSVAAPITVRRRVREVAGELPPRVDRLVAVDMAHGDRQRYADIAGAKPGLLGLAELRVLTAHADAGRSGAFSGSPKVELAMDMLQEIVARGERALIFASFTRALDRLTEEIGSRFPGTYVAVIDGRVEPSERQHLIDEFSAQGAGGALLLNPGAAGVGLNITAANHVIHFNPEWNPAVTEQATARAYRRRQKNTVFVHHLFYADSVEEDAVLLADSKRELADGVFRGHRAQTGSLEE